MHYVVVGRPLNLDARQTWGVLVAEQSPTIDEELLRNDPILYYTLASKKEKLKDIQPVIESLKNLVAEAKLKNDHPNIIRYLQSLETLGAATKQDMHEVIMAWISHIVENQSPGVAFTMLTDFIKFPDLDMERQNLFKRLASEHGVQLSGDVEGVSETLELSKKDWFKGVVTVWVRTGYLMKYGLSFPNRGLGTGFFIDKKGYLITNYHVIAPYVERPVQSGFSEITIEPSGSRLRSRIPVEIIGYSKIADLALLRVKDYTPELVFSFADESTIEKGDRVYALGSPGGQTETLTGGLISHTERNLMFMSIGEVLQIDAPVNFGNSGGPLLNEKGEILGVIFAKNDTANFEGMSFALPLKTIRAVLPLLMIAEGKSAKLPFMGIAMTEVSQGIEASLIMRGTLLKSAGVVNGAQFHEVRGLPVLAKDGAFCDVQLGLMRIFTNTLVKAVFEQDGKRLEVITRLVERSDRPALDVMKTTPVYELYSPVFGMVLKPLSRNLMYIEKVYEGSEAAILGIKAKDTINIHETILNIPHQSKIPNAIVSIFRVFLDTDAGMPRNIALSAPLDAYYWL